VFYPKGLKQKDEFSYYSSVFNTVELNSTFYRIPNNKIWLSWATKAPNGFLYAVKMNRQITHLKRLRDCVEEARAFIDLAKLLGDHLGPILLQMPPSFTADVALVTSFAQELSFKQLVFEFRHPSWFEKDIIRQLKEQRIPMVIVSHPRLPTVWEPTSDIIYLRCHGSESLYSSDYTEAQLQEFAFYLRSFLESGMEIFVYFNNDIGGFAPKNARRLIEILGL